MAAPPHEKLAGWERPTPHGSFLARRPDPQACVASAAVPAGHRHPRLGGLGALVTPWGALGLLGGVRKPQMVVDPTGACGGVRLVRLLRRPAVRIPAVRRPGRARGPALENDVRLAGHYELAPGRECLLRRLRVPLVPAVRGRRHARGVVAGRDGGRLGGLSGAGGHGWLGPGDRERGRRSTSSPSSSVSS